MSHTQPKWEFKARFRRNAFGWKSQPAITRVKQAVSEIRRVARKNVLLAAEGAVTFRERVSPAIQHVDGSSGAIGTAVNKAVRDLVPIIADDKRWGVRARAAMGRKDEAIQYAEDSRGRSSSDTDVDALCEEIMLSSGLVDEAYERYGLAAHRARTYLAWFRAVARTYPHKEPERILADLVAITPGDEGKWFAAAKTVGLFDKAIALAASSPCDPKTLIRAARDYAETEPSFAGRAGLLALHWLAHGYGYEITGADVWAAYSHTMKAAEKQGIADEARDRVRSIIADAASSGESFVGKTLGRELGL